LKVELEAVFSTRPTADWERTLGEAGIVHAPVERLSQVLGSEQVRVLEMVGTLSHPVAGDVPSVRLPVTLSDARTTASDPPPALGSHSGAGFDSSG
jgi:crotonobetainyl-CoA:carnitine CoA-transferase CaiB-like acyl-CoA transferase